MGQMQNWHVFLLVDANDEDGDILEMDLAMNPSVHVLDKRA